MSDIVQKLRSWSAMRIAQSGSNTLTEAADEIDRLRMVLKSAELQIVYLQERWQETGSGNAVLAGIRAVLEESK